MRCVRMRTIALAAGACVLTSRIASAQQEHGGQDTSVVRVHALVGYYAPRGVLRELIDDGYLVGGQVAYHWKRHVALLSSVTITQSGDRRAPTNDDAQLTLIQFDVGAEVHGGALLSWPVAWFLGAGAGGRAYRYTQRPPSEPTVPAAYGSAGTEWKLGSTALRLELRNYLSGLPDDRTSVGRDLQTLAGLSFHFR